MPAIAATAPGKIILFGEHAVVYGRPAIAVPVLQVTTRALVLANPLGQSGKIHIEAPDIGLDSNLDELSENNPFVIMIQRLENELGINHLPAFNLRVTSTIPVAAGLGSGAAVSVACLRALSTFIGKPLLDSQVCELAFEVEKQFHGTPSGIDNTVITYAKPIYFERGKPIEIIKVAEPISLLIANSGTRTSTAEIVGTVRQSWQANPQFYDSLFDQVAALTHQARQAIESGKIDLLGPLMTSNHTLLQEIGVSNSALDRLVEAAQSAGALGTKLSGAGRGGNIVALVTGETSAPVAAAIKAAGATGIIQTVIPAVQVLRD